ncbi:MAG TPA: SPW repeat protein [Ramlibacter sp.]|nr:SPW repeat protein [Ramlibacter sp.]
MTQSQLKHWQDPLIGLLGVWLAISPWVLGFTAGALMTASVVLGVALVLAAIGSMYKPQAWEEWAAVIVGLVTAVSPWMLGFAGMRTPMTNAVVVGLAAAVLALWSLARDGSLGAWAHDHIAH